MNLAVLEGAGWKLDELSGEPGAAVVDDVKRFIPDLQKGPAGSFTVSRKKLSFYPDYELLRIGFADSQRPALWGLYAPGDFWSLDGSFDGIYRVNRCAPLELSQQTIHDYTVLLLASVLYKGSEPAKFSVQPVDGDFLIQVGNRAPFAIGSKGEARVGLRHAGSPIPRVRPIQGVRRWTLLAEGSEELEGVLADLKWNPPDADDRCELLVRRADISFYATHHLYEVLLRRDMSARFHQFYFLHDSKLRTVWPLYGESRPVHETNHMEPPMLETVENAREYLRFFCWATRAAEGRFLIVERFRDIPWREAPSDKVRETVLRNLKPMDAEPAKEGAAGDAGLRFRANVSYGDGFFEAVFSVSPAGLVKMESDNPIAGGLAVFDSRVSKLTTEAGLTIESEPETYLDEHSPARPLEKGTPSQCDADQLISLIEESNATPSR